MSTQKRILTLLTLFLSIGSSAQMHSKKFKALFAAKDTAAVRIVLKEWEDYNPNDPEMLVAAFNYYVYKGKRETTGRDIEAEQKAKLRQDTTAGSTAFIKNVVSYDSVFIRKAIRYINFGIKANPNRLDMRFGKIYLMGELHQYKTFTNELVNVIEQSHNNKNAWRWINNVPNATPFDFMMVSVHHYIKELSAMNDPAKIAHTKTIAQTILKYYPDETQTLITMAGIKMEEKQYDNAYAYLRRAKAVEPNNENLLLSFGNYYKLKGDNQKALEYYQKCLPMLQSPEKEIIEKEIEQLKPTE